MMIGNDETWMDLALKLARSNLDTPNTPVASVIVRDGVELGQGRNLAITKEDPLLHAEIVAIQDACRRTKSADLSGATLYSTMEPCPMCAWAIVMAGIDHVVLGASNADVKRTDLGTYTFERLMEMGARKVRLTTGVRNLECTELRREWSKKTGRWH